MRKTGTIGSRIWRGFLILLAIIAIIAAGLFVPWNTGGLASHSKPAQNYAEAVQRIQALQENDASKMNPDCITQFMTHGQKTEKVIIFVHGYTSCPAQFKELGQRFHALGYNVLIASLPRHGLADRMTDKQGQLRAEELTAYADQMVDIADGLGEQITMAGLSAGGVTTAWAAQNRKDVDLAVIISPAFGFKTIPTNLTAPVMNVLSHFAGCLCMVGRDFENKLTPYTCLSALFKTCINSDYAAWVFSAKQSQTASAGRSQNSGHHKCQRRFSQ